MSQRHKYIFLNGIREQDPLKQGLKPCAFCNISSAISIREQDPLKQGLKRKFLHPVVISYENS